MSTPIDRNWKGLQLDVSRLEANEEELQEEEGSDEVDLDLPRQENPLYQELVPSASGDDTPRNSLYSDSDGIPHGHFSPELFYGPIATGELSPDSLYIPEEHEAEWELYAAASDDSAAHEGIPDAFPAENYSDVFLDENIAGGLASPVSDLDTHSRSEEVRVYEHEELACEETNPCEDDFVERSAINGSRKGEGRARQSTSEASLSNEGRKGKGKSREIASEAEVADSSMKYLLIKYVSTEPSTIIPDIPLLERFIGPDQIHKQNFLLNKDGREKQLDSIRKQYACPVNFHTPREVYPSHPNGSRVCLCCRFQEMVAHLRASNLHGSVDLELMRIMGKVKRQADYVGLDETTFVKCTGCGKSVCPHCCSECPDRMCRDIQCTKCKPNAWGFCDWHANDV
ncbi:MAG: hypothetical protein M1832_006282 [Thelocarpon impressellum]|nr:MAG: hypothetical protein M1832_006282 [Thelocarpon impressellum]